MIDDEKWNPQAYKKALWGESTPVVIQPQQKRKVVYMQPRPRVTQKIVYVYAKPQVRRKVRQVRKPISNKPSGAMQTYQTAKKVYGYGKQVKQRLSDKRFTSLKEKIKGSIY